MASYRHSSEGRHGGQRSNFAAPPGIHDTPAGCRVSSRRGGRGEGKIRPASGLFKTFDSRTVIAPTARERMLAADAGC